MTGADLGLEPNAYSRPLSISVTKDSFEVGGYQEFALFRRKHLHLEPRGRLMKTDELLTPFFDRGLIGKDFIDMGCNAGYWSLRAGLAGADWIIAVDIDPHRSIALDLAVRWLGVEDWGLMERFYTWTSRVTDYFDDHEVVCALGLIHWLYHLTGHMSLEEIVAWLADLTTETLIVEWISANDPDVVEHGHLGSSHEDWTEDNFVDSLGARFVQVTRLGYSEASRVLYLCEGKR